MQTRKLTIQAGQRFVFRGTRTCQSRHVAGRHAPVGRDAACRVSLNSPATKVPVHARVAASPVSNHQPWLGGEESPIPRRSAPRYRVDMGFGRPRKLYTEDELYQYAVGALGRRMRSVAELKRLLRNRVEADTEIGKTLVELIIVRLKDRGYLNDAKFAAAYSSFRLDNEKFGRRRVITDLKIKGVHGDVIEKAVDSVYEDVGEEKLARDYLRRKRLQKPKDQKQAARIFRQLMRAGFGSKTIFTILKKWDVDDDTLTMLESEALDQAG